MGGSTGTTAGLTTGVGTGVSSLGGHLICPNEGNSQGTDRAEEGRGGSSSFRLLGKSLGSTNSCGMSVEISTDSMRPGSCVSGEIFISVSATSSEVGVVGNSICSTGIVVSRFRVGVDGADDSTAMSMGSTVVSKGMASTGGAVITSSVNGIAGASTGMAMSSLGGAVVTVSVIVGGSGEQSTVEGDNTTGTGSEGRGMTAGSVKVNGDAVIGKDSAGGPGGTESVSVDIATCS